MRRAWVLLLLILLGCSGTSFAQDTADATGRIAGVVQLEKVGAPVAYAQVGIRTTSLFALTKEDGSFVFERVLAGTYTLVVVEDSIEPYKTEVMVQAGRTTTIECIVAGTGISGVEIVGEEVVVRSTREPEAVSRQTISREELAVVPGAAGDAIRVVENLPGVAQAPLSRSFEQGLVIRGTSPEDSKYFFNGFELPQLFHLGALISIINSELLEEIAYYPGGYGVKYGDALGGVIEVSARKPRTDRFGGVVDLATYSSYVMFEGPAGEKASWAGAVRRSFIDFILPEVLPEDQQPFTVMPTFYDYTGIFQLDLDEKNSLQFIALGSDDQLGLVSEDDPEDEEPLAGGGFRLRINWHRADLMWTWLGNSRVYNKLGANVLFVETDIGGGNELNFRTTAIVPTLRNDLSVLLGQWNELRFGVQAEFRSYKVKGDLPRFPKEGEQFAGISNTDLVGFEVEETTYRGAIYVDDVMEPADWLQLIPGVRVNYDALLGDTTLDPRLTARFYPTERSVIKAATGLYHQWPQDDESAEEYGTSKLDAEVAILGNLGFEYDFGQGYFIDAQGFYKELQNLVSPTEAGAEEPYDNAGEGFVYGAEFLARKKMTDRFFGWTSYTFSVSRRKDRPDSDWRYFDQDQRHNFVILGSYELGKKRLWRLGAKWQFSTGLPFTDLDGSIYNADTDSYIPIWSDDTNAEREDSYHQLDLRVDKLWKFTSWSLNTYLDVQNVYFSEYPAGYEYNFDYSERQMITFPLFYPSIGAQARF